jgi:hypothetical protein
MIAMSIQEIKTTKIGSAGGIARGIISHHNAMASFVPKPCKQCGRLIEFNEGDKISWIKKKVFCDLSCSSKYNTNLFCHPRRKDFCLKCAAEIPVPDTKRPVHRKYCDACLPLIRSENGFRIFPLGLGKLTSEMNRATRLKQLEHESAEAKKLESYGYEVFSPTVVCDRVAVKDGKVFFVEFKSVGQKLRPGQQRIKDLVPNMYLVQYS